MEAVRKAITAALVLLLLGPLLIVLSAGVLVNTALTQSALCRSAVLHVVGDVPDSLTATTADGDTVTLNRQQLTHASTIILTGTNTAAVGDQGILVALVAALTESSLRQLANSSAYPESAGYPNDGNGSDHDSIGLFQMRPQAGWGTVQELMDPAYQAAAFYGGEQGPNHGSPRGLLDLPGWQSLTVGEAAQAVEVSAFPDRYQNFEPVARSILDTLTTRSSTEEPSAPGVGVPETNRLVFPLPEGTYRVSDVFGPRVDPVTGGTGFHRGTDFAAPDGTPILSLADGRVSYAGMVDGYSGQISIEHTIDGAPVASTYIHMWEAGIFVQAGDWVTAGQQIGEVGSSGRSTGPHLHLQIHPGGTGSPAVDPQPWLTEHAVGTVGAPSAGGPCTVGG